MRLRRAASSGPTHSAFFGGWVVLPLASRCAISACPWVWPSLSVIPPFSGRWCRPYSAANLDLRYWAPPDRKSTRLNSSHLVISYAVFCLKKKQYHSRHDIRLHADETSACLS